MERQLMTSQERIEYVQREIEQQKILSSAELERLANIILADSLKSQNPLKKNEEYPILSKRQMQSRRSVCISYETQYLKPGESR